MFARPTACAETTFRRWLHFASAVCACQLLLGHSAPLAAQITTGILTGVIRDEAGLSRAGVVVTITGPAGQRWDLKTNPRGKFQAVLPYGTYQVDVAGHTKAIAVRPLQATCLVLHGTSSEILSPCLEGLLSWPTSADKHPHPGSFSLSDLLMRQDGGVVTEPLDFGGLASTSLALVSREGFSWTATKYSVQGMDATDPYQPGRALLFGDVPAVEEVVVQDARASRGYGSEYAVFLRQAGEGWHGELSSHNTASPLAADNLPPRGQRGALLRPERFHWYTRNNLQAGGPLTDRADVFVSGTGQWASQSVPDEPPGADLDSRLLLGNARGRLTVNEHNQLDASFSGSRLDSSGWAFPAGLEALAGRRMAPSLRPHSALEERNRIDSVQAGWTRQVPGSSRTGSLQIRYGYSGAHLDTTANNGSVLGQSRIELTTGAVEGAPRLQNLALRTRHSIEAGFQPGEFALGSQRHQFLATAVWQRANIRNRSAASPDLHAITAEGAPAFVVELNTPLDSRARVRSRSLFVEDRASLASWVSLEAGVLLDFARGGPARPSAISWNSVSPRSGLALRLPGLEGLVVRGSFARSYHELAGRYLDFGNSNSLGGLEYRWRDLNGDRLFQPGEKGELLRRFGGPHSSVSPSLRCPYADQFAVAAEMSLPWHSYVGVRLFRRDEKDRIAALNTGVPLTAYQPRVIPDPGPDFIAGTFDDQPLVVYEQDPATFGQDQFLLTNPGLRMLNKGLIAEIGTRRRGLECRASLLAVKSFGSANPGNEVWENDSGVVGSLYHDPNTLIHAAGRSFFDRAYVGKLHANWQAPRALGGLEVSGMATYLDGLVFGRRLLVTDLPQGPLLAAATVRGSPEGGHRTQFLFNWDLRLSRGFALGRHRLRLAADVFNVTNRGSRLREDDLSGPRFNERLPLAIQSPRFVRFGLVYYF